MGRLGRPSPSHAPAERARAPQRGARLVHRFTVLPRWPQEPASGVSAHDEETVLWAGVQNTGRYALRLRYRTDALDASCAARIAGYHLAALASLAADPEAEHAQQSLLSADELELQLEGLAGPRRELPNRRVHELIEERACAHPDRIAALQ